MSDVVERAEAALEGVTKGPWKLSEPHGNWIWPHVCNTYGSTHENARFIAAARTLVPELVAELKAARAEVDAVRAFADELENATELSNGAPSIVAKSFAAEIRRRLRGEAR